MAISFEVLATALSRVMLILLFFPFSALDKVINFSAAVGQAREAVTNRAVARAMILVGIGIEMVMSIGVLTGIADRLAALVLCAYCVATAVLFKQFWTKPDFALRGPSQGREVMWDFLKNFAVAGGFFVLALGADGEGIAQLEANLLASTHPYSAGDLP